MKTIVRFDGMTSMSNRKLHHEVQETPQKHEITTKVYDPVTK